MKFIELHILQSYPVSCLNRDDMGSPKSAVFGGVTRSRISSQCLKHAIRLAARQLNATLFAGNRTRKAAADLAEELTQRGWDAKEARDTALKALHALTSGKAVAQSEDDEEPTTETTSLLYLSPEQIRAAAQSVHQAKQDGVPSAQFTGLVSKAVKGIMNDAADIAIFGRMVAAGDRAEWPVVALHPQNASAP
jgi:CRISPR system Cascade subunit CasC